jgi:hypothetical protein
MLVPGIVILSLSGCSGSGGAKEEPVAVGPVATPTGRTSTAMPFEAYVPSESEVKTLAKASNALINSCMAEYGFTTDLDFPSDSDLYASIRQGTSLPRTLEQAERYGFKNAAQGAPDSPQGDQNGESGTAGSVSQAQLLVLNGAGEPAPSGIPADAVPSPAVTTDEVNGKKIPEGGCQAEATRQLAKGAPDLDKHGNQGSDALNVMLGIRADAKSKGAQDPVYTKMVAAWAACMKQAGYPYSSFNAAAEDPEWATSRTASAREIAVATTDIKCRTQVNYLGVADAVNLAYEKRAVDKNAELLQAVKDYYQAQLRNAAKVV